MDGILYFPLPMAVCAKKVTILDHTRGVLEKGMEVYMVSLLTRYSCEEASNKRRHQGPFHAVLVLV